MKRFEETNGRPKRTRRSIVVNAGSPTSCEAHGDGAAIVAKRSGQRLRHDEGRQVSLSHKDREVRVMRTAETILELIRERGKKGLPLERVYKLLFNQDLYLKAYGKIYRNKGAMTHGVTEETPDGMSLEKIDAIIEALRYERYQWLPARRTYIPKANGKKRPLGMPICLSYCLSFQAMFGIPMVANGVDQKSQPTLCVLLYHVLLGLSTPTAFPVPLRRLAQLRDDV